MAASRRSAIDDSKDSISRLPEVMTGFRTSVIYQSVHSTVLSHPSIPGD
jgi:hypothetical protein